MQCLLLLRIFLFTVSTEVACEDSEVLVVNCLTHALLRREDAALHRQNRFIHMTNKRVVGQCTHVLDELLLLHDALKVTKDFAQGVAQTTFKASLLVLT